MQGAQEVFLVGRASLSQCDHGDCGNDTWPVTSISLEENGFLHLLVGLH